MAPYCMTMYRYYNCWIGLYPLIIKSTRDARYVIINYLIPRKDTSPFISEDISLEDPKRIIQIYGTLKEAQADITEKKCLIFLDTDRLRDIKAKVKNIDHIIIPYF